MKAVRYCLRRWARRPGFALPAILILGLGIGTTTAMFSVLRAVLLAPLPWRNADRLVAVHAVHPQRRHEPATSETWNRGMLSMPAWDALRAAAAQFEDVAVWRRRPLDSTLGDERHHIVHSWDVSSNFLPMLGVGVNAGRHFNADEESSNSSSVILTHEVWIRRFNAEPDLVGRSIVLGSASSGGRYPKVVVGILEPGFTFDNDAPEVLFPVGVWAATGRTYPSSALRVVARLTGNMSLQKAGDVASRSSVP